MASVHSTTLFMDKTRITKYIKYDNVYDLIVNLILNPSPMLSFDLYH